MRVLALQVAAIALMIPPFALSNRVVSPIVLSRPSRRKQSCLHREGWDGQDPFADVCNSELEDDETVIEDE